METEKLKDLAMSGSGLIFDPASGYIFTGNPTGIAILNSLKEGKSPEQVKEDLMAAYECDGEVAERDIADFISQLIGLGLITDV